MFPWYALKVRASGELKVRTALEIKNYKVFLPTYLEGRKYSDRIKKVEAAYFPGYLFARLDLNYRLPVLQTPGVESIVSFGGVFEPVPEQEILSLQKVVDSGTQSIAWPYLKQGDHVRVQFGALQGAEGILIRVKGVDRLVISVNLLQRAISTEIDRSWVRPISANEVQGVVAS